MRQERHAQVAQAFNAFASEEQRDQSSLTVIKFRCSTPHRDGKPLLAKAVDTRFGLLFKSTIDWLPQDQLTLPEWDLDALLSDTDVAQPDEVLVSWWQHLGEWSAGLPADGPRWLKNRGARTIHDVLTLPKTEDGWLPRLWVRCRLHPGSAEALSRSEILAAKRRGASSRAG